MESTDIIVPCNSMMMSRTMQFLKPDLLNQIPAQYIIINPYTTTSHTSNYFTR